MNCRICGQPKAGPEKLCGACAGALKRASEAPAAVRKVPPFGAKRVKAVVATVAGRPATLTPASLRGRRRQVAWTAVALATIGVVFLGQRAAERPQGLDAAVLAGRSPMPWSDGPKIPAAPVPARLEALPSTAGMTIAKAPAPPAGLRTTDRLNDTQGSVPPAPTPAAEAAARTRPALAGTNPEPSSRAAPSPKAPPNDAAVGKSKAGALPEAGASPQLTPAGGAQPDQAADDAKVLASALDKCGKENFLAGFICEQKAYLRYCDGKWGQVPQCTKRAGDN
jgi:hypothetical protein